MKSNSLLTSRRWKTSFTSKTAAEENDFVRADESGCAGVRGAGWTLIFCMNVLIYFTEEAAALAGTAFFMRALEPGGYLFLGHSESISKDAGEVSGDCAWGLHFVPESRRRRKQQKAELVTEGRA